MGGNNFKWGVRTPLPPRWRRPWYHNVLHMSQSGFRQCRKTTDHLLRLHDAIRKSMSNKHNVLSVFIDIENAYDMVNKEVLLSKLLSYGISGRMFHFIRTFLSN